MADTLPVAEAPPTAKEPPIDEEAYVRLERATAGLQAPFALVDLDALWANAQELRMRSSGKPIRLASKSLRCRALQERVLARGGFQGTLAFTLPEALWLASHGTDDILVAYPTADTSALRTLAEHSQSQSQSQREAGRITCPAGGASGRRGIGGQWQGQGEAGGGAGRRTGMVDRGEGLGGPARATGAGGGGELGVRVDVGASWWTNGGRVRVGVKRSP